MPINTIRPTSNPNVPFASQGSYTTHSNKIQDQRFATILDNQLLTAAEFNSDHSALQDPAATSPSASPAGSGSNGLIPLGKIDKTTPSISHLLTGNTAYQHESWEIIFAKVNKNKQFTNIQQGTVISLNPANQELVWAESQSQPRSISGSVPSSLDIVQSSSNQCKNQAGGNKRQAESLPPTGQISLGTLDVDNPTLSHLLKNNAQYGDKTWNIIFSGANRNKPYTSLRPGCQVSINPQTLELSFSQSDASASPRTIALKNELPVQPLPLEVNDGQSQQQFSEKLAESVKTYLGKPYHDIDCYGLVVKGLTDQGVQYSGSGGLLNHLERMAARHGLPANAYQNGEGLIKFAGNKLFDKSFVRVKDAEGQSAKVMEQLEPLLQEGMLLSFSTPRRGHTGVIAKKDGQWTYVNSGMIDHQINGGKVSKRVGEEKLEDEITNWFRLAKNKRTSLKVSAGMFDTQKIKDKGRFVAQI
ncbi:MAG: hypothetical protein Q8O19_01875 [Rectinemataceae bacterium]|nr:hypothetical protein [Rectinemataceae bacterium]